VIHEDRAFGLIFGGLLVGEWPRLPLRLGFRPAFTPSGRRSGRIGPQGYVPRRGLSRGGRLGPSWDAGGSHVAYVSAAPTVRVTPPRSRPPELHSGRLLRRMGALGAAGVGVRGFIARAAAAEHWTATVRHGPITLR